MMKPHAYFTAAAMIAVSLVLPRTAPAADIQLPYEQFTLDNGLTVIVHEDRKAPIVAVSVWYHVGSKDEPEGKTGFAHLFEHLMFNGSENHDKEYFEPLEEIGATALNGTTWFDRTNYFQNVPTPALDLALWLESDRMGHLLGAVTQEKLDNQRGVVQNEKRQGDNQPYGLVEYRMLEGLFPVGHPYRHSTIGSMADLDAASLEDVHEWFKTYYGPNNAILVLAGDIDAATARPLAEKYFGDIPAGPPLRQLKAWVPERATSTREVMQDRVPNARIYRAWTMPGRTTQDYVRLELAARALSMGKSSRLYKDLVYDSQLATAVDASIEEHELASIFTIEIDVKKGVEPATVEARLDRILGDFLAKGPSKSELERGATTINATIIRGLEQVGGFGGKAVALAEGALYAGDPNFILKALDWIEAATPADVKAAAGQWLSKGYYQLTVLPFGAFTAAATGADRSAMPAVEGTPDLSFPSLATDKLANGIEVVLAERHAVPVVQIAIQFDAGYAADQGARLGTASFAMAMLDEGTRKRNALQISEEQERLGAQITASSNLDTSSVSLNALKENLGAAIDLWADIVRNPIFDKAELERLRQLRLAQIAQEKAQPVGIALRELPPLLYGAGHAYGIPFTGSGTEASVQAIARDDLLAFQSRWLRPDNARVFVVGATTMAEIKPLLEKALGDWQAPSSPKGAKNIGEVALPAVGRILIVDRPGSPQSLILAGHVAPPTGADNNIAIEAMNDVIGGQFTARVNMNLREDKGWAYGALTLLQNARGQRPYLVYAPVQTDRTADSLAELIKELKAFTSAKPATEAEMVRVVNNAVRSLPGQFETSGAVLGALLANSQFDRPLDYQASLTARFRALGLDDVRAAAREVIQPDKLIWLVVGDRAKIEAPLRALGLGEVALAKTN
ncbi:MAG: M16 family metallopeptidase [Pseudomonadota bacterium]